MKNSTYIILLTLFILTFTFTAFADSWALPEKRTICSNNNNFCLKVIPKNLESQLSYFKDKVDEKKNVSAVKEVKDNYCKGIFYSRDKNGKLQKQWQIKLVNEVSPVDVLVSNDGKYVITFDNWHSVGYGDDTVVIYETSKREMTRKLGLSDFLTESDIYGLPKSVSSIWWSGQHFISKDKKSLVLQVVKKEKSAKESGEYFLVNVDLKTGTVLDPKKDRLPMIQLTLKLVVNDRGLVSNSSNAKPRSSADTSTYKIVSSANFLKMIVEQKELGYPAAARAANVQGFTTFAVSINENGEVVYVKPLSGHPLFRKYIANSVKTWKFQKNKEKYIGVLTFEGRRRVVYPK